MTSEINMPRGAFVSDQKSSQAAVSRKNPERSLQLALAAAEVALENGATDIVLMDMTAQTASFDYFVVATGTSQRQLRAISEDIDHKLEGELATGG
jgi:ribosome-associated protein